MPEGVSRAAGDDGDARIHRRKERRGGRIPAAVMGDLENVRGKLTEVLLQQLPLCFSLHIAGEENATPAHVDSADDRLVVQSRPLEGPCGGEKLQMEHPHPSLFSSLNQSYRQASFESEIDDL